MNKMNAIRILLLLLAFLAIPLVGKQVTPPIILGPAPGLPVHAAPLRDKCLRCGLGSNAAWFQAYDDCRAADPNGPPSVCTAAGDRAAACFVLHNWSGLCESCGGNRPDEAECGE